MGYCLALRVSRTLFALKVRHQLAPCAYVCPLALVAIIVAFDRQFSALKSQGVGRGKGVFQRVQQYRVNPWEAGILLVSEEWAPSTPAVIDSWSSLGWDVWYMRFLIRTSVRAPTEADENPSAKHASWGPKQHDPIHPCCSPR